MLFATGSNLAGGSRRGLSPRRLLMAVSAVVLSLLSSHQRDFFVAGQATLSWSITSARGHPLDEELLAGPDLAGRSLPLQVTVSHPNIRLFKAGLKTDRSVIPGSCRSLSTKNQDGWNKWKSFLNTSIFVNVDLTDQNKKLNIYLVKVSGFALLESETIRCGPLTDAQGTKLYTGDIPAGDEVFQLEINSAIRRDGTAKPSADFLPYIRAIDSNSQLVDSSGSLKEWDIRNNGLLLYFVVRLDVWKADKLPQLIPFFTCGDAVDCLKDILLPRHFTIPPATPNILILNISRTDARLFDIPAPVGKTNALSFGVNGNSLAQFTLKGLELNVGETRWSIRHNLHVPLVAMIDGAFATPALETTQVTIKYLPNNQLTITENCLRGKEPRSATCPSTLFFKCKEIIPNPADQLTRPHFHNNGPNTAGDISRHALTSKYAEMASLPWLKTVVADPPASASNLASTTLGLILNAIPGYETWVDDTIEINLPFSVFANFEAPLSRLMTSATDTFTEPAVMSLIVKPSPGFIRAITFDVEEADIRQGGMVMYYVLDGESFWESTLDTLLEAFSTTASEGWATRADCFLPPGSITFNKTATGKANTSVIKLSFVPCKGFHTIERDTVTLDLAKLVGKGMIRSRELLTASNSLSFLVRKSPGEMVYTGRQIITETDIWNATWNFTLELTDDKWNFKNNAQCAADVMAQWVSNVSLGPACAQCWSVMDRKREIIGPNLESFVALSPDNATMTFQAQYVPGSTYDTGRAETILITVPGSCTKSGEAVRRGEIKVTVKPRAGFAAMGVTFGTPDEAVETTAVSESKVRAGKASIVLFAQRETWDITYPDLATEVVNALVSNGSEAFGWNVRRSSLIANPPTSVAISRTKIVIDLAVTISYDIRANETLFIPISSAWVDSRELPTPSVLMLTIFASAGHVNVSNWFGSSREVVTEEDVRHGRLWFEFTLIGDQFRRDQSYFANSFFSADASPTSFGTLVRTSLMPDNKLFNFTVPNEGVEVLNLQLQTSAFLDVHQAQENIFIRLQNSTVESGINPVFLSGDGVESTEFAFSVARVPGRLVVSGSIFNLDEKKFRQSTGMSVYLTLVGDQWSSNGTVGLWAKIKSRRAVASTLSGAAAADEVSGFNSLKASLLPPSRVVLASPNVIVLNFQSNRNYEINDDEIIDFTPPLDSFKSGLKPITSGPLEVLVQRTGGEIRAATGGGTIALTEIDIRSRNFTVSIAVDGDNWNQQTIVNDPETFLSAAFNSLSSLLREPRGFAKYKDAILGLPTPVVRPRGGTIQVMFQPTPLYDITEDETIVFTATANYVNTLIRPDPSTVSITVLATSRTIVCVVDDSRVLSRSFRFNTFQFASVVANMLSVSPSRIAVRVNTTAYNDEKLLVLLMNFAGSPSEGDFLSFAELTSLFFAVSPSFREAQTAIRYAYPEDDPSQLLRAAAAADTVSSTPQTVKDDVSAVEIIVWVSASVGFLLVIAIGYAGVMHLQGARHSVGVLGRSKFANRDRYGAHGQAHVVVGETELLERQRQSQISRAKEVSAQDRLNSLRERVAAIKAADGDAPSPAAPTDGSAAAEPLSSNALASLQTATPLPAGGQRSGQNAMPMKLRDFVRRRDGHFDVSAVDLRGSQAVAVGEEDDAAVERGGQLNGAQQATFSSGGGPLGSDDVMRRPEFQQRPNSGQRNKINTDLLMDF